MDGMVLTVSTNPETKVSVCVVSTSEEHNVIVIDDGEIVVTGKLSPENFAMVTDKDGECNDVISEALMVHFGLDGDNVCVLDVKLN